MVVCCYLLGRALALSSSSLPCIPVMVGGTRALPDSTSHRLEWPVMSQELIQQAFPYNVFTSLYDIILSSLFKFLPQIFFHLQLSLDLLGIEVSSKAWTSPLPVRVSSRGGGGGGGKLPPPKCPASPPKEKEKEREKGGERERKREREREREGNGRQVGGAYIWVL